MGQGHESRSIRSSAIAEGSGADALARHYGSLEFCLLRLEPENVAEVPRAMKMKVYASFDRYLAGQTPRNQDVIRALRKFVKRVAPQLQESVKWGNGCWVEGKVPVAYVYSAPDHVQFGFFRGSTLKDPRGLLNGEGKFVRHIKVRKRSDIDEKVLGTLLRQAAK